MGFTGGTSQGALGDWSSTSHQASKVPHFLRPSLSRVLPDSVSRHADFLWIRRVPFFLLYPVKCTWTGGADAPVLSWILRKDCLHVRTCNFSLIRLSVTFLLWAQTWVAVCAVLRPPTSPATPRLFLNLKLLKYKWHLTVWHLTGSKSLPTHKLIEVSPHHPHPHTNIKILNHVLLYRHDFI